MSKYFIKAKPVYPKEYKDEMNISVFFTTCVEVKEEATFKITGNSIYRVFDNGNFSFYGPARSAHEYYRVDNYKLNKGIHTIVIELAGYNCNSYYVLNTIPFLQCEIVENNEVLKATGYDFDCYLNSTRFQKVTRFSFQRTFSESYEFNHNIKDFYENNINDFPKLELEIQENKQYLKRNVDYPTFDIVKFHEIESGNIKINDKKKKYEDRYMYLTELNIFDKNLWEVNPNDYVSLFEYNLGKVDDTIKNKEFKTFDLEKCYTGFIDFEFFSYKDSKIYLIFEEINTSNEPGIINLEFYRNTTHNIISYFVKEGTHHHITFEAYTMRYLRVVVDVGEIKINDLKLIKYENPLSKRIEYNFSNPKINKILDAGVATFAQNAVDILTDCPSRERAGWLCDSYFSGKAEQLITGQNIVEYNFLENYAISKQYPTLPVGMIPMCYPGEYPDKVFIPNWSLFYIIELEDYLKRTANKDLINKSLDKVYSLLKYFSKFENEFGLLENLEGWIFVEWSKANDKDFVKGVNIPSNMLYYRALLAAYYLTSDITVAKKAKRLKENIINLGYNGNFFIDNLLRDENNNLYKTNNITETCQYYAFYFEVAEKEKFMDLWNNLENYFGPNRDYELTFSNVYKSNVFIGDYLRLSLLLKYGSSKKVLEETIDYFYNMAIVTGTLWEHDSTYASLNHGFTSFIVNIIVQAYFGLKSINVLEKKIYFTKQHINEEGVVKIPLKDGYLKLINNGDEVQINAVGAFEIIFDD